jgi:hypothetical protein
MLTTAGVTRRTSGASVGCDAGSAAASWALPDRVALAQTSKLKIGNRLFAQLLFVRIRMLPEIVRIEP